MEQAGRSYSPFGILIVDDDAAVIGNLSRILHEFSPLRSATSGEAALNLARATQPDLILLDVEMPGLSGFEVCSALKSERALADIPVVFISGHQSPQLVAKGIELGAADFIAKPPQAPLVVARVRAFQRIKSLSDSLRNAVTIDFETGASTQREFEKIISKEWLRAERSGAPLGFLLVEIDDFCVDSDHVLQSVAEAVRSGAKRAGDAFGRYAGGKFGLLLPDTDRLGTIAVATRIQTAAGRIAVSIGCAQFDLAASVSQHDSGATSVEDLLASAETALDGARQQKEEQKERKIVLLGVAPPNGIYTRAAR